MTDFKYVCGMIRAIVFKKHYLGLSLSAICFVALFTNVSCDAEEEATVPVTGILLSDDGTPISGLRVRFYDYDTRKYLSYYIETDINGVFAYQIPRRYEMIEAHCFFSDVDSTYLLTSFVWNMKVDPEIIHTIMIPRKSEIVLNFAPKEPSVPRTRYRIKMEYKFIIGGYLDSQISQLQESEFDSDTIAAEAKRRMLMPRNREVKLQITKYDPNNYNRIISQMDTIFVPTNRKSYMLLRW